LVNFCGLVRKHELYNTPEKNQGDKLKKKSMCAGPETFESGRPKFLQNLIFRNQGAD
jgi:hypothetical protein